MNGALPVHQLGLGLERLAPDAVPTRVHVLVHVARVVQALQEVLDEGLVSLVACSDEEVIGRVQPLRERAPRADDPICVLLRLEALLLRDARNLRCVLVDAREEEDVVPALAMVPRQDVGSDRRVRVPDMRRRVDVVDRCRHVVAHRSQ